MADLELPEATAFSFNLLDQPWVPCVVAEGAAVELSLWEALERAGELREVADASPLVTVAVQRLLLAVLHRALDGPRSAEDWEEWWEERRLPLEQVRAYLEGRRGQFDLFDAERPFYQTVEVDPSYAVGVGKLTFERGVFNGDELFSHEVAALRPAAAARALLAHQAFALGGLISFQSAHGEHAAGFKFCAAAPTAKGALVLLRGQTLLETLLLNLVRYSRKDGAPFPADEEEKPAWEREAPARVETRWPHGYVDYLTWQSRRIRLLPERDGEGAVVRRVVIMKGVQLPPDATRRNYETMMAFTKKEKAKEGEDPWPAVALSRDRAMWRNSQALLESLTDKQSRPRVLDWAEDLRGHGLSAADRYRLDVYGMDSYQAAIYLWRHEQLPLPLAYLGDSNLVAALKSGLDKAEEGARALRAARLRLAELALAPNSDQANGMKADPGAIRRLADSFGGEAAYWGALDRQFGELLEALPEDVEEVAEVRVYGQRQLPRWIAAVKQAARNALEPALEAMEQDRRTRKAAAIAHQLLEQHLGWLTETALERAQRLEKRAQATERRKAGLATTGKAVA